MAREAEAFRYMYSIMPIKATWGTYCCIALYCDVNYSSGKCSAI